MTPIYYDPQLVLVETEPRDSYNNNSDKKVCTLNYIWLSKSFYFNNENHSQVLVPCAKNTINYVRTPVKRHPQNLSYPGIEYKKVFVPWRKLSKS